MVVMLAGTPLKKKSCSKPVKDAAPQLRKTSKVGGAEHFLDVAAEAAVVLRRERSD